MNVPDLIFRQNFPMTLLPVHQLLFLIVLATIVIGWGAQDLMITSAGTSKEVNSMPLIIYGIGGVVFIILSLITF